MVGWLVCWHLTRCSGHKRICESVSKPLGHPGTFTTFHGRQGKPATPNRAQRSLCDARGQESAGQPKNAQAISTQTRRPNWLTAQWASPVKAYGKVEKHSTARAARVGQREPRAARDSSGDLRKAWNAQDSPGQPVTAREGPGGQYSPGKPRRRAFESPDEAG